MEYAEDFRDLPLDSPELVNDCKRAAFHLGWNTTVLYVTHFQAVSLSN